MEAGNQGVARCEATMESRTVWFGENQSCISHAAYGDSPHNILHMRPVHAHLPTLLSPDDYIFTRDAGVVNFEFAWQGANGFLQ